MYMVKKNMNKEEEENEKKRYGRKTITVSLKFSPVVWSKFREIAERENLGLSDAVEMLMSDAISRGYIDKAREPENIVNSKKMSEMM